MRSIHQDLIQEYMTKSVKNENLFPKQNLFINDNFLGENKNLFSNNKNYIDLFGENKTIVNDMDWTRIERAKYEAKQKVLSYLIATEKCTHPKEKLDPLKWWQDNKHLYPNVAKCV